MVTVTDKLNRAHLAEWRKACAMRDAVSFNPEAFDAKNSVWIFEHYYTLAAEYAEAYGIELSEEWAISPYTGIIYYED